MTYDVREKTEIPENFGKNTKKSKFPYKSLEDPKYLKDKQSLLRLHGNGWWWIDRSNPSWRRKHHKY